MTILFPPIRTSPWRAARRMAWCAVPLLLAIAVAPPSHAGPPEADREAILAMLGDFEVSFAFDETRTLDPDAEPSAPHRSEAIEIVRLIEDSGGFISLQHILLAGEGDERHVIKHWRQDWRYQAEVVYEYQGNGTWGPRRLPASERRNAWTQTVFQVDDSPRYGGAGRWVHHDNYSYWESNHAWRPLPPREHTQRGDYDVLVTRNRHAVTPDGWTQEQDSYKLALRQDSRRVIARETGLNTYARVEDADVAEAEAYWEETQAFWAEVRAQWDAIFAKRLEITLLDAEDSTLWRHLFRLARDPDAADRAERIAELLDEHVELREAK